MKTPIYHPLGDGVYCIDALYTAPNLASCYLLDGGGEYALIETGTPHSVANILATLGALGVAREKVVYVIPTHVHLDHAGGAGVLMGHFPNARLLIHPRGARHMIDPTKLVASATQVYGAALFAELYGEILPVDAARVTTLEDGDRVTLGRRGLTVRHMRGHAEHHFCLFDERTRGWFSGDMFGVSYPGQRFEGGSFVMPATTPTQFDPALYQASVRALADADPRCFYLTHFSALPFDTAQADSLCRQLDAYATLGETCGDDSEGLVRGVLDIARDELARLLPMAEAAAAAEALRMDAHLNAQGIAWWHRHRE